MTPMQRWALLMLMLLRLCVVSMCQAIHAWSLQVIARRALLRWLYEELLQCANAKETGHTSDVQAQRWERLAMPEALFAKTCSGKYTRQGRWQLHMFISQPPCGDACIFAGDAAAAPEQTGTQGEAQHTEWHRTGAKRLKVVRDGACQQNIDSATARGAGDLGAPAVADREGDQQVAGVLRRKPGRGDPTLSLSCRYA